MRAEMPVLAETPTRASLDPAPRPVPAAAAMRSRLLVTDEDKDELFALRYACYKREGNIDGVPTGRFTDQFDSLGNTYNVGLFLKSRLVAAIRIAVLSTISSESSTMSSFGDLVRPLLGQGHLIIDPSRFIVDAEISKAFPDLAHTVLRIPFMAAGHFNATYVLATVRAEHMAFYRRVLRCEKIAEPRPYLGLNTRLNLMIVNYPDNAVKVISRYPTFKFCPSEPAALFGPPFLPEF